MSHVAEGTIQALLDGELSAFESAAVQRHLEGCPACRAELDLLRSAAADLSAALVVLDLPAPLARAQRAVGRQRWRRWAGTDAGQALRRAAVLVLGVAAVASATVPGSPLRRWVEELRGGAAASAPVASPVASAPAGSSAGEGAPAAAVSILPAGGRVRVVLRHPSPGVRIEVSDARSGEVEVLIPRSARTASVEVDGRPYLRKDADGLRLLAPVSDSSGSEIVFNVQP
jgi:hypothetical protein